MRDWGGELTVQLLLYCRPYPTLILSTFPRTPRFRICKSPLVGIGNSQTRIQSAWNAVRDGSETLGDVADDDG